MSSKNLLSDPLQDIVAFVTVVAIFTFLLVVAFSITWLKALLIVLAYFRVVQAIEARQ
jgi:hypothetical protein